MHRHLRRCGIRACGVVVSIAGKSTVFGSNGEPMYGEDAVEPARETRTPRCQLLSLEAYPWIEQSVSDINREIQHQQKDRVKQNQSDGHCVITIDRTVDQKHSDARYLENIFDHK